MKITKTQLTQTKRINFSKIAELDRLCIFGATGCGKSYLANKIAYQLTQTHQVFIFHSHLPWLFRDLSEVFYPYQFSPLINFRLFHADEGDWLINELEKISQLSESQKKIAVILDEFYSNQSNHQKILSSISRDKGLDKVIIVSQEPTVIDDYWDEYHKLFGRSNCSWSEKLKDLINRELKKSKSDAWKIKHKYYCDWIESLSKSQKAPKRKSCWLLDEIDKPLTQEILIVD